MLDDAWETLTNHNMAKWKKLSNKNKFFNIILLPAHIQYAFNESEKYQIV